MSLPDDDDMRVTELVPRIRGLRVARANSGNSEHLTESVYFSWNARRRAKKNVNAFVVILFVASILLLCLSIVVLMCIMFRGKCSFQM